MLAEHEVDLWQCTAIDLMSDEEDGGVSRWICASSVLSQLGAH